VPGANGQLVCQMACSPSASACTVDADCCSGLHCYVAVGSTSGACGGAPPPPSGYDAGAPPAPGCSFYGQSCMQNSDCCNGVNCNAGTGGPCAGAQGCICATPLQ
jgi:hypothetical protein